MKAQHKNRPLRLNRDTVRTLGGHQLAAAGGGILSEAHCGFSAVCYSNHCFTGGCDEPVTK